MANGQIDIAAVGGIVVEDKSADTWAPMQCASARPSKASGRRGGVLVLVDLGSAILSTKLALDLLPEEMQQHLPDQQRSSGRRRRDRSAWRPASTIRSTPSTRLPRLPVHYAKVTR
jgi:hypothetical protein